MSKSVDNRVGADNRVGHPIVVSLNTTVQYCDIVIDTVD